MSSGNQEFSYRDELLCRILALLDFYSDVELEACLNNLEEVLFSQEIDNKYLN